MKARPASSKAAFRLRDYRPVDFDSLCEIDATVFEPPIAYSRPDMRAFLNREGAECVVAEAAQATASVVGFCITERKAAEAYIVTIDVLEPFRKRGVGGALLGEAEKRLVAKGVRNIALDTAVDNTSAISFWERHGYRKIGVRKGYYPNGLDAFAMTKPLAP